MNISSVAAYVSWRIRGEQGHLMLGERIASKYEVIRAILLDYSP